MGGLGRRGPLLPTAARPAAAGAAAAMPGRLEGAVLTLLVVGGLFVLTLSASLVSGLGGGDGAGGLLDGAFHGELLAAAGAVEGAAGAGYPAHTAWAAASRERAAASPPTKGGGGAPCQDLNEECAAWAAAGHCEGENRLYMLGDPEKGFPPQCAQSCGLCGGGPPAGAARPAARDSAAGARRARGGSLYQDVAGGVRTVDWEPFDLGSLAGKATLVVNAASG